jgi:hypothetical protein
MNTETALAILPSDNDWARLKEIGATALKSGLLPTSIKTPEAAAIIALKGWELGLKPLVSFAYISVVNGRPTCAAELMLAEIRRVYPKAIVKISKSTDTECVVQAKRPEEDALTEFKWTIEDARKAGLLGKDNWKNYPADMLFARTITRMKRRLFPEVLMGVDYVPEELGAEVDQQGRVVKDNTQPPAAQGEVIQFKKVTDEKPQTIDVTPVEEPKAQAPEMPTEPIVDRDALAREIMQLLRAANLTMKDLEEKVKAQFNKTLKETSNEEMLLVKADLESLKTK